MIWALGDVIKWLESQSPENLESEIPKLSVKFIEDTNLSQEQIMLLERIAKMFDEYCDTKINFQNLKGIFSFLSNQDRKILLPLSQRGSTKSLFMFDERMSVKEIIKFVMGMVKNRNKIKTSAKNLPKYKTVIKNKLFKFKDEETKFSLDISDLQKVKINFAKRKKLKYSEKNKKNSLSHEGRIIRFSKKKSENIAIVPTILNAIKQGNYFLKEKKFNIQTKNFLYPEYEKKLTYNIMLVLDTSKSISWLIPHIEKFIFHITSHIFNSRDKIGLITFSNDLAKIYHYPTLNVRQIIGTINKIKAKGKTPLGNGLNLALQVLSKDQYQIHGAKNFIILISDCFPEPLEGGHKNLLDEPAYKFVLSVSKKIRNKKLGFIIINPAIKKNNLVNWNKKLIDKIINITKANYIEFQPVIKYNLFKGEKAFIDDEKLTELINIVTDIKMEV